MSRLACGIVCLSSVQSVEKEECDAGVVLRGTSVLPVLLLLIGHLMPLGQGWLEDVVPKLVKLFEGSAHGGGILVAWVR